jgi:phosphatidylserine/phosphatidylglycerophosphate/cardiolipin synthase-like enzyme
MSLDHWFLTSEERGNPHTAIDRRHPDGRSWTEGNIAEVLVDGRTYFAHLFDVLCSLDRDDWVHFTDWEGDPDERLRGKGTEVANVLCDIARRGVHVRGLLWRSHPRQAHFGEQNNVQLTKEVNEAGGEILLDERVRRGGSHHQKLFVVRHAGSPDDDVAFVGGIDLCHGRNDDAAHRGDPQAVDIDDRYGDRPPWHDAQVKIHGPAVSDVAWTFRERWEDDTPLDHRNPVRLALRRTTRQPRRPDPFAPQGERSVARAYLKALIRARRLIYFEDQYFWSRHAAQALAASLRANPDLHVIAVVPRYPDEDGRISGPASRIGRQHATEILEAAGGERVLVCDLENREGTPIYVHAKVCVIDDVWMTVGSDNLNRRSWTHDSELTCAILDATRDEREPRDPGGLGDGARRLARDTRLRLWCEHLGREDRADSDLVDPMQGFDAFRRTAAALDEWHRSGRPGPRPPGHVRVHAPEHVSAHHALWAHPMHRAVIDPDGRPRSLRRTDGF